MTTTPAFDPTDATVIDDLTFDDLLRIALEDAPGASQGHWTVHGPVDPGITLVELFAWLLEQRLYMAEQVTDPVVRASLRLLGVAGPAATRVARTVLCLDPTPGPVEVPAGTMMDLRADEAGRRFRLDESVTVLPIGQFEVNGRLRAEGDVLDLCHHYRGPALDRQQLSLLAEVAAAPGVAAAWSEAAVEVPAPAELVWTAVGPDGREMPVSVTDQTCGFRRSGLLRLSWPDVWNALGAGQCRLRARAVRGRYTEDVAVRSIRANAAPASHRQCEQRDVGDQVQSLAPLPGQRLSLPDAAGVLLDAAGDVSLVVTELDGREYEWSSVADWTRVGPADRVMVLDRLRGEITFGDGRTGRILRASPGTAATATYALGGGEIGNVGPGNTWVRDGGAETASNPVPAEGGAGSEGIEAATERAAGALRRADRVVTAADAKALALATPGVGIKRAHVTAGLHPDFPCETLSSAVSVTVVPYADRAGPTESWTRAPQPDAGVLAAVAAQLRQRRLVGQEVFALPPAYRRVKVWLTISQSSQGEQLDALITTALRRYLDPLRGGPDKDGWPFGGPVRPSALVGVVRLAIGPEALVEALSVALDGGAATDCGDLAIGSRELVYLDALSVTRARAGSAEMGLS